MAIRELFPQLERKVVNAELSDERHICNACSFYARRLILFRLHIARYPEINNLHCLFNNLFVLGCCSRVDHVEPTL